MGDSDSKQSVDFQISLLPPEGWREIAVEPEHRDDQVRRTLAPMRHIMTDWDRNGPNIQRALLGAYAQAWDAGVRYAISSQADDASIVSILASYMISVLPSATPTGANQLEEISDGLLAEKDDLLPKERMDLTRINLDGVGPAVQAASVRFVTDINGNIGEHQVASLRTFIPCGNNVVLATGITPQVEFADTLFALFARITETIRIRQHLHADAPEHTQQATILTKDR